VIFFKAAKLAKSIQSIPSEAPVSFQKVLSQPNHIVLQLMPSKQNCDLKEKTDKSDMNFLGIFLFENP